MLNYNAVTSYIQRLPEVTVGVLQVDEVPELFLTAVSLTHDKTGAKHLHVARDDPNNTFR